MTEAYTIPGASVLTYDSDAIGKTKSGIQIQMPSSYSPIIDDLHGAVPAGFIFRGASCIATCMLIEYDDGDTVDYFKNAHDNAAGGLLGYLQNASGGTWATGVQPGTLASSLAKVLSISAPNVDQDAWVADLAILSITGGPIKLASTSEVLLPIQFLILPDSNGDFFSAGPLSGTP